jgi:hypothetical protein
MRLTLYRNRRKQQDTSSFSSAKDNHEGPIVLPKQLENLTVRTTTLESHQHELSDTNKRQMDYRKGLA